MDEGMKRIILILAMAVAAASCGQGIRDAIARQLDAFVRSANAGQNMTPEQWTRKWKKVAAVIRSDFPDIPLAEDDLRRIDSYMAEGEYILHHSPEYGEAYHPHYRIIARDIFESDVKPCL